MPQTCRLALLKRADMFTRRQRIRMRLEGVAACNQYLSGGNIVHRIGITESALLYTVTAFVTTLFGTCAAQSTQQLTVPTNLASIMHLCCIPLAAARVPHEPYATATGRCPATVSLYHAVHRIVTINILRKLNLDLHL